MYLHSNIIMKLPYTHKSKNGHAMLTIRKTTKKEMVQSLIGLAVLVIIVAVILKWKGII